MIIGDNFDIAVKQNRDVRNERKCLTVTKEISVSWELVFDNLGRVSAPQFNKPHQFHFLECVCLTSVSEGSLSRQCQEFAREKTNKQKTDYNLKI